MFVSIVILAATAARQEAPHQKPEPAGLSLERLERRVTVQVLLDLSRILR
jgi:hypothetical protein